MTSEGNSTISDSIITLKQDKIIVGILYYIHPRVMLRVVHLKLVLETLLREINATNIETWMMIFLLLV